MNEDGILTCLPGASTTPISLCDLPFELLLKIAGLLEPPDICTLGKTSMTMQMVSRDRSVWHRAIQVMSAKNAVFEPSFGDINSLPTEQLRQISLGPYRFLSLISNAQTKQQHDDGRRPYTSQIWPHVADNLRIPDFNSRLCNSVYLIPGGRYMLSLHNDDLQLWDLGCGGLQLKPKPILLIASLIRSFSPMPTRDSQIIAIRLRKHSRQGGWFQYEMYTLNFSTYPPVAARLSSITLKSYGHQTFDTIDVDHNRMYIMTNHVLTAWDYVKEEVASWDTDFLPVQVVFEDDAIIAVDGRTVAIWKVPDLQPYTPESPINATVPPFIGPTLTLDLPPAEQRYNLCGSLNSWYTNQQRPLWFDMTERLATSFIRLFLHKTDPNDILSYMLTSSPRSELANDITAIGSTEYRPCNDSTVLCNWWVSLQGRSVKCHVWPVFFDTPVDNGDHVVLRDIYKLSKRQFSMCPVSGRTCHVDHERNCIVASQFLSSIPNS